MKKAFIVFVFLITLLQVASLILLPKTSKAVYSGGQNVSTHWICGPPWYCGDCFDDDPYGGCCWETRNCDVCGDQEPGLVACMATTEAGGGWCYWTCSEPTPEPTAAPTPTPDTTPPTCTISGLTSVNINTDATYVATGSDSEGNLTEVEIFKSPTEDRSWTNVVDGCAGPVCQGTTQFSSEGTYYVTCTAYDSAGNKCSGNPWCREFPPVVTPEIDCPGWSDCTSSDLIKVRAHVAVLSLISRPIKYRC